MIVLWILWYYCSIHCQFILLPLIKFKYSAVVGHWFWASGWLAWRENVVYFILGVLFVLWILSYYCSIHCQFIVFPLSKFKYSAVVGHWFGASGWLAWREKVVYFILRVLFVFWILSYYFSIRCQFIVFPLSKFKYSAVVGCWFGAIGWLTWRYKVVYFILGVLFVLWILSYYCSIHCQYIVNSNILLWWVVDLKQVSGLHGDIRWCILYWECCLFCD